jgi:hypothetical protein
VSLVRNHTNQKKEDSLLSKGNHKRHIFSPSLLPAAYLKEGGGKKRGKERVCDDTLLLIHTLQDTLVTAKA